MEGWDSSLNDEQKRFSKAEKKQNGSLVSITFAHALELMLVNTQHNLKNVMHHLSSQEMKASIQFVKSEKPVTQSSAYSTEMFHFLEKYEQSMDDFCEEEGDLQRQVLVCLRLALSPYITRRTHYLPASSSKKKNGLQESVIMLTIQNSWTTDSFPALKISISGIRDMNHWLRVLVVLPEDAGSVPSTYVRQVSTACNSNSMGI